MNSFSAPVSIFPASVSTTESTEISQRNIEIKFPSFMRDGKRSEIGEVTDSPKTQSP